MPAEPLRGIWDGIMNDDDNGPTQVQLAWETPIALNFQDS